jgi:hypothetical protein
MWSEYLWCVMSKTEDIALQIRLKLARTLTGDPKWNGRLRMKKKKKLKLSEYEKRLNPMITVDESQGERLYAIVDFSLPGDPEIRRIISKSLASGNITAVTYIGKVGLDCTCTSKRNIMTMENVSPEKFWKSVRISELLYKTRGATIEIRNYSGKTMREAAELMQLQDNAKVWMGNGKGEFNV